MGLSWRRPFSFYFNGISFPRLSFTILVIFCFVADFKRFNLDQVEHIDGSTATAACNATSRYELHRRQIVQLGRIRVR
jgi:hypothetical protein